jgi:hypothetical protein
MQTILRQLWFGCSALCGSEALADLPLEFGAHASHGVGGQHCQRLALTTEAHLTQQHTVT